MTLGVLKMTGGYHKRNGWFGSCRTHLLNIPSDALNASEAAKLSWTSPVVYGDDRPTTMVC